MSNEITTTQPAEIVTQSPPKKEIRVVRDDSSIAYLLDTSRFEHCYRIAGAMARASLIPKHLKGPDFETTQANCFLVVNQAMRWQLDPFSIAPETYEVGGKLGFQGKLVAAVINARAGLSDKLSYTFNGLKGDAMECTVSGRFNDESEPRTIKVNVKDCRTPNQMWTKDPEQKLVYTGAIKWARRHKPEVILGVLTDDDADMIKAEQREASRTMVIVKPDFSPTTPEQPTEPPQPTAPRRGRPPGSRNAPLPAVTPVEATVDPAAPATPADDDFEPVKPRSVAQPSLNVNYLKGVRGLLALESITEAELLDFGRDQKNWDDTLSSLEEVAMAAPSKLAQAYDEWTIFAEAIKAGRNK